MTPSKVADTQTTSLFEPRTFSTDWEVMVVDKLERPVGNDKLTAFAGVLRDEFLLPIGTDWNTLEFAVGINRSLAQIWERIQRLTDRAAQLVREWDCELFPAAAHPAGPMYNASHIHVGTLHDEARGILLENQMGRFAPAFAALAANSPFTQGKRNSYKSNRVREQAHHCTFPSAIRNPALAQPTWGTDAGPKLHGAPTFEVRITDCASSRRFLAELATFVAAFVHHQGTRISDEPVTAQEYTDNLTNRWSAARYGLQATFRDGEMSRPVVEILSAMLDECAESLALLGGKRSDLPLLETMLQKRICQADYIRSIADRYPDPLELASVYAKLMRHWDIFDTYVAGAAPLDPVPVVDSDAVLAEHLAGIGEGTYFYRSRNTMLMPPPFADSVLDDLIAQGKIVREVTSNRGITLSRRL